MGVRAEPLETKHDFFAYNKLMLFLLGYSDRGIKTIVVRIVIYVINYSLQAMAGLAWFFVEEKEQKVLSLHSYFLTMYTWWALGTRVVTNESVVSTRKIILEGVYNYEGEEELEEAVEMKKETVTNIQTKVRIVGTCYGICVTSYMVILVLLSQLFPETEKDNDGKEVLNPLLPEAFYIPFDTRTPLGFTFGLAINLLNSFLIYGMATIVFQVYYSCTSQLKVELRILCYSLQNIETRARKVYLRSHPGAGARITDLYSLREFQDCIYMCLRSNALHHQAIIRFFNALRLFCGTILFISVAFAPALFACDLYLILTNPTGLVYKPVMYGFVLFCEIPYNYYLCYAGEEVLQEYFRYQESLYSMPWYNCNKRFNNLLLIMIRFSTKPLILYTTILRIAACQQTFGDIMSMMYKIMNLWRQNDL